MTLQNSTFADAKRLLANFKDAERVNSGVYNTADAIWTQFRVPIYGKKNLAAAQLLYAALQAEFGNGSITLNDDDMFVFIPGELKRDELPVHRLEQGLHKVRKALLAALEQKPDGTFTIDKSNIKLPGSDQVLQGANHIDLEDLAKALVDAYTERHGHKQPHGIEATYDLPKGKVHIGDDRTRHAGEVKQESFANYIQQQQKTGALYVPFTQAERRISFNGEVTRALYMELGVDVQPHRYML